MKKQILAAMDLEDQLAVFTEAQRFVLLLKKEAKWQQDFSYDVFRQPETADEIRIIVNDLANQFKDCNIIVGRKVSGIAYQMLDKKGYAIFEAEAITDELLDIIIKDILKAQAIPDIPPQKPYSPQDDGNFYFDLARLQKACPEISSKMALMDFIRNTKFMSFELVCDHLPPWLEQAMEARGLEYDSKRDEEGFNRYLITRRMCD
jgi:Fe-only nitrogenase accessory protein AnfO